MSASAPVNSPKARAAMPYRESPSLAILYSSHLDSPQGQDLGSSRSLHGVESVGVNLARLLVGGGRADDVGDPGCPGYPGRHDGGHRVPVQTSGDVAASSRDGDNSERERESEGDNTLSETDLVPAEEPEPRSTSQSVFLARVSLANFTTWSTTKSMEA